MPVSCRVARQRRVRVLRDWLLPRRPGHPRLTARMRGLRHHSAKQPQPQAESTARHFVSSMRQPKASFDHAAVQASQTPVSPRLAIASLPQKSRQNVHSHFCQFHRLLPHSRGPQMSQPRGPPRGLPQQSGQNGHIHCCKCHRLRRRASSPRRRQNVHIHLRRLSARQGPAVTIHFGNNCLASRAQAI